MGSSSFIGLSGSSRFSSFKKQMVLLGFLALAFMILSGRVVAVSAADDSLPKESPAVETVQQPAPETDTDVPSRPMEKTASDSSEKTGEKEDPPAGDEEDTEEQMTPMSATGAEESETPSPPEISTANIDITQYSGAAVADIPIIVPPGRAGIQPQLALTYNSNAKLSWVGKGWDLSLPSIRRSIRFGLDYTKNEYESTLNGGSDLVQRPDWGSNFYGEKIEGRFVKYFYNTSTKGWEAFDKSGRQYFFGTTDDSRQSDPEDPTRIFKWCLDKVLDTNDNFMTISYAKESGQIYLSRIDYTGNEGGAPLPATNAVIFHTKLYPSPELLSYTPQFKVVSNQLLEIIEVTSNDGASKVYHLKYEGHSGALPGICLTRIRLYGNETTVENGEITGPGSIKFDYNLGWEEEADAGQFSDPNYAGNIPGLYYEQKIFYTDVNGDGLVDRVMEGRETINAVGYQVWIYLGNGSGQFGNGTPVLSYPPYRYNHLNIFYADINGDGMSDRIVDQYESGGSVYIWESTGDGSFKDPYSPLSSFGGPAPQVSYTDINGDGFA